MPVIAKLSRKFYDTFGDEIATELVDWLNQVDAAYRSEFRDLFEVHFGRFEAGLHQFAATVDAKMDQLRAEMRAEYATKAEVTALRIRIEALESRLIRWMFVFWIGTVGTLVALLKL
jgi:hypothetical protein